MNTNQVATLPCENTRNGKSYWGEKEVVSVFSLITADLQEVVTLRIHCSGTGGTFYASLWVHDSPVHLSGHGKASGYGYCRGSAAASEAFRSAGITLSEDIAGRGYGEVEKALKAVGLALGHERTLIVRHG